MRIAAALATFVLATASWAQTPTQTIVFVCEHGAAKSVVAAAHFNKLAQERGLPFRAISRGTAPDPAVPAGISTGLKSDGLSLPAGFTPALVGAADVSGAARVVIFDVTLPIGTPKAPTRWDGMPAFSDGYAPASAAIRAKVEALIGELQATAKKQ